MKSVATNQDVKKLNRLNTLKAILVHGKTSQPALAKILGHSGPTVLQNVKELTALGLVKEDGDFSSTGGRKARGFSPVYDARMAAGVEVTKNHLNVVVVDLAGKQRFYQRISKPFVLEDAYFQFLAQLVDDALLNAECPAEKVMGVGISLPGIVDGTNNRLISSHVLSLWDISTDCFKSFIDYPCFFINDANAAGLAENHRLNHPEQLIYISLSNSVGGALMHDSQVFLGTHLRAGEIGHMTLIPNGKQCYCGKTGCLDAYCNAEVLSGFTNGNLEAFFTELKNGNQQFAKVWQEYLDNLAIAVNNLHMIFDCDIMLGGYVGSYIPVYAPKFRDLLAQRNTFGLDSSYLKFTSYKTEAAAIGAALQPLEHFLHSIDI